MKKFFAIAIFSTIFLACQSDDSKILSQFEKDITIIEKYLSDNNLQASKTVHGIYYIIDQAGTNEKPTITQTVVCNYTGVFTDGEKFDSGTRVEFPLYGVIEGWQIGIPLFGKGGKGKLLIPSRYAYGPSEIKKRKNAVLIFDVELLDFK